MGCLALSSKESKRVVGLSKFDGKDRRRQRRNYKRNEIFADLKTPKYRERTFKDRKRVDNADGTYYIDEIDDTDENYK